LGAVRHLVSRLFVASDRHASTLRRMKQPEDISYLLVKKEPIWIWRGRSDPADLDEETMRLYHQVAMFKLGQSSGRCYKVEMDAWYRNGCKGPEPVLEKCREYYLMRHLERQRKRILKFDWRYR
jgi:hypothetical protein